MATLAQSTLLLSLTLRYFDRTLGIIKRSILGWDDAAHRSRNTPGIFGFTKGFLGAVEAQGSSNLHCHFLGSFHCTLITSMDSWYAKDLH
jgi:hypothetical protein